MVTLSNNHLIRMITKLDHTLTCFVPKWRKFLLFMNLAMRNMPGNYSEVLLLVRRSHFPTRETICHSDKFSNC